jgi:hypothetical protein
VTGLALALALASAEVSAYSFKETTVEEKVSDSAVVVIGRVISVEGRDDRIVTVRKSLLLKGFASEVFTFSHNNYLVESTSRCCSIGGLYIFFLEGNERIGLAPVRGTEAIRQIEPP